ncbi:hypothetical protein ACU4GD_38960 [Cupriavidus basilensis]
MIGVRRTASGLDTDALDHAIRSHAPRALFINTVLQNPTGGTLTSMNAHRVLQLAEQYRLRWSWRTISHRGAGARRPAHAGGHGRPLARDLHQRFFQDHHRRRCGWATSAASPDLAKALARTKMAVGLTSSEVTERLVYSVLTSGHYGRRTWGRWPNWLRAQAGPELRRRWKRSGLEVLLPGRRHVCLGTDAPARRERAGRPVRATGWPRWHWSTASG